MSSADAARVFLCVVVSFLVTIILYIKHHFITIIRAMMSGFVVHEIRVGMPISPSDVCEALGRDDWPEKTYSSGYLKLPCADTVTLHEDGIEGDGAGYPSHISDHKNRGILVYNVHTYEELKREFPDSVNTLKVGGFAENFVVDDPALLPAQVCIGDVFSIGSATVRVSGPRQPCPKVDAFHGASGMTKMCAQRGWAGYFLKVIEVYMILSFLNYKLTLVHDFSQVCAERGIYLYTNLDPTQDSQ